MSHGAMLGVTSFGHLLGAGAILGPSNMGVRVSAVLVPKINQKEIIILGTVWVRIGEVI